MLQGPNPSQTNAHMAVTKNLKKINNKHKTTKNRCMQVQSLIPTLEFQSVSSKHQKAAPAAPNLLPRFPGHGYIATSNGSLHRGASEAARHWSRSEEQKVPRQPRPNGSEHGAMAPWYHGDLNESKVAVNSLWPLLIIILRIPIPISYWWYLYHQIIGVPAPFLWGDIKMDLCQKHFDKII